MITINLPAETVMTLINLNSKKVTMDINTCTEYFTNNLNPEPITSMWVNPVIIR